MWKARPKRAPALRAINVRYVLLIGTLTVIVLFAILCADQGLIALACVWVFAPGHPGAFFCA